jgi:hypothetical protein
MEAVIRKELSDGNDPYQTVMNLKGELHEDYGQWHHGIPRPETEEEMNDPENIEMLAEWIAAREEVTVALMFIGSEPPTKENEITITPEEEYPMLEEVLYGMMLPEYD